MSPELDKQLCDKYPKIFRDRNAPMNETCMCWGFECRDGWYTIIDMLCFAIQTHIDGRLSSIERAKLWNEKVLEPDHVWTYDEKVIPREIRDIPEEIPQVVATQIKEKFGTLRFYYNGGDDVIDGYDRMAELMSSVTCEVCGNPGKIETIKGWVQTLCDEHRK